MKIMSSVSRFNSPRQQLISNFIPQPGLFTPFVRVTDIPSKSCFTSNVSFAVGTSVFTLLLTSIFLGHTYSLEVLIEIGPLDFPIRTLIQSSSFSGTTMCSSLCISVGF
eukprot:UN26142